MSSASFDYDVVIVGSRFDITSGAVVNGPATEALNVYEVQEAEGTIRLRA